MASLGDVEQFIKEHFENDHLLRGRLDHYRAEFVWALCQSREKNMGPSIKYVKLEGSKKVWQFVTGREGGR